MSISFRKDIINYFISIIIPGAVNFFSIPLIKWFLGANGYGEYALWYGAFLVFISGSTGWLGISIIRFRPEFENANFFYRHLIRIILYISSVSVLIGFCSALYFSGNLLFSIIFSIALVGSLFQNSIMAVSQSNFLSRFTIYSESIRMITFLTSYVCFLSIGRTYYLEKLFFSLILSYTASFLYLKKKNNVSFAIISHNNESIQFPYKVFFKFGIPLILWYLFSAAIPYMDKLLVAKKFGHLIQGNYQAIFDLIYRAVGIVFAPVLMASFPYLTKAYKEGNIAKVMRLIKNTVLIEFGIMLIAVLVYILGGGQILMKLLNIPNDNTYFITGVIILVVAFIWQIAMMLHKPFELIKKTNYLLLNNFIALLATLVPLYFIYRSSLGFIAYPIGVLSGATCYALLCIYQVRMLIRKKEL